MSESSISTSLTSPYNLFTSNEIITCSIFNLKMFLLTITVLIIISCLIMLFTSYKPYNKELENFANNQFFSYRDTINPGYFYSQIAPLTSMNNSLISGQASKIISKDITDKSGNKIIFYLDLYCSLYVLYGNPFGEIKTNEILNEHYLVYLVDKNEKRIYIDKLYKDPDGVYKLKFKDSNFKKYTDFNKVLITHIDNDNNELEMLSGNFTLS